MSNSGAEYNYRIIKSDDKDHDKPVVNVTLELSHAEINELFIALTNHVRYMTNKNYYYHDMRNINKVLNEARMELLKQSKRSQHLEDSSYMLNI